MKREGIGSSKRSPRSTRSSTVKSSPRRESELTALRLERVDFISAYCPSEAAEENDTRRKRAADSWSLQPGGSAESSDDDDDEEEDSDGENKIPRMHSPRPPPPPRGSHSGRGTKAPPPSRGFPPSGRGTPGDLKEKKDKRRAFEELAGSGRAPLAFGSEAATRAWSARLSLRFRIPRWLLTLCHL